MKPPTFSAKTCLCLLALIAAALHPAQAEDGPDRKYFPPTGAAKEVALLLLGGSEGGLPNYYDTTGLTAQGYPCLLLGYFGTKSTPPRLELIPLEYFEEALRAFRAEPEVGSKKIVVWGGSKGGELALLLASRYPQQIRGVIAAVPSAVVFQGIGGKPTSSWSHQGKPLPFVPYADYDWSKIVNSQYGEVYRLSLLQTEAVARAAIEVEKINGPVLLLTGKADTMWPSSQMGEMVVRRLEEKKFPHRFRHFAYADAGHTLNDGYMMGGTPEGNRHAREDSARRIAEFLESFSVR